VPHPTRRLAGTQLGAYVIGKQIGAGGMGTVYEAQDVRLNRKVAIKILPPPFVGDPDRIHRFRQEARAASLLNHPNIVSIYDAELAQGRCYIATEFVEGTTLRQLAAEGPMDSSSLIEIATKKTPSFWPTSPTPPAILFLTARCGRDFRRNWSSRRF
jgi:serine/threonine protein kinase